MNKTNASTSSTPFPAAVVPPSGTATFGIPKTSGSQFGTTPKAASSPFASSPANDEKSDSTETNEDGNKQKAPKKSIFEIAGPRPPKSATEAAKLEDESTKESKSPSSPLFTIDNPETRKKEAPEKSSTNAVSASTPNGKSIFGVAEPKSKKSDETASEAKTSPFSGAPKTPYSSSTEKFDTGKVVDVASVSTPDDVYDYVEEDDENVDKPKSQSGKAEKSKEPDKSKAAPSKPVSVDELWEITTPKPSSNSADGRSPRAMIDTTIDADVVKKSSTSTRSDSADKSKRKADKEQAVIYNNTGDADDDGFDDYYGRPPTDDNYDDEDDEEFNFAFAPRSGDDGYDDDWGEEIEWAEEYTEETEEEFEGEWTDDYAEYDEAEEEIEGEWADNYTEYDKAEEEFENEGEFEGKYTADEYGEYDDYWDDDGEIEDGYWEDPPMRDSIEDDGDYYDDEDEYYDDDYEENGDALNVEGPFVISDPPQAPENFGSAVAAAAMAKTGGPIPDTSFMPPEVQKQISRNPVMNVVSTPFTPSSTRQSPLNNPDVQSLSRRNEAMGSVNTGAMMTPRIVKKNPASQSVSQASTPAQNPTQGAQSQQRSQQRHFQVSAGTAPESFGSAVKLAASGLSDAIGNSGAQRYQQEQEAKKDADLVDDVAMKFYRRTWNIPPPQ
jgi:hypothetical protein